MPLTPNFTMSQSSGTPNIITATDTSTGSDVLITSRRIYLLQADGTYLVETGTTTDYTVWALADTSISLDVLSQDTAISVTVQWLDVSNAVLYTKTIAFGFDAFGQNFFYGLSDGEVPITNPPVVLSSNYFLNKVRFYCYLTSGGQAISYASDIQKAQLAYDLDQEMITNTNYYF